MSQKLLKLIRDGVILRPDLMLSYSGINDVRIDTYDVENHFFMRKFMADILFTLIKGGKIKNWLQININLKTLTFGIENWESKAEFWIRCERTMYAVCKEFGIKFHAFLQPKRVANRELFNGHTVSEIAFMNSFFDTISTYISRCNNNDMNIGEGGRNGCMTSRIFLIIMKNFSMTIVMFMKQATEF